MMYLHEFKFLHVEFLKVLQPITFGGSLDCMEKTIDTAQYIHK